MDEQLTDEDVAREVVLILSKTHQRLGKFWDRFVSDVATSETALISSLQDYTELFEFIFPKLMAIRVLPFIQKLKLSNDELTLLLFCASRRRRREAQTLCTDETISPQIERVAKALQLTLNEPEPNKIWQNESTKLACLFAFHMSENPINSLNTIFGSVVRSDIRRCEDLHDESCSEPLDTLSMCRVVECLSKIIVL